MALFCYLCSCLRTRRGLELHQRTLQIMKQKNICEEEGQECAKKWNIHMLEIRTHVRREQQTECCENTHPGIRSRRSLRLDGMSHGHRHWATVCKESIDNMQDEEFGGLGLLFIHCMLMKADSNFELQLVRWFYQSSFFFFFFFMRIHFPTLRIKLRSLRWRCLVTVSTE